MLPEEADGMYEVQHEYFQDIRRNPNANLDHWNRVKKERPDLFPYYGGGLRRNWSPGSCEGWSYKDAGAVILLISAYRAEEKRAGEKRAEEYEDEIRRQELPKEGEKMHPNQEAWFEQRAKSSQFAYHWVRATNERPELFTRNNAFKTYAQLKDDLDSQQASEIIGLLVSYEAGEAEEQEIPEGPLEEGGKKMGEKERFPKPENPYRRGSKRERIAREILDNWDGSHRVSEPRIFQKLLPKLKTKPLVFRTNKGVELPTWKQHIRLRAAIMEVNNALVRESIRLRRDVPKDKPDDTPEKPKDKKPKDAPKPKPAPKGAYSTPLEWLERVQNVIRPYVRERNIAEASMRLSISGARMYRAMGGDLTAFKAVEHAFAISLPDDAKSHLKIEKFNPATFKVNGISQVTVAQLEVGEHRLMRFVELQHAAGIPTALVGPAGCGKSYLPYQFAKKHGLEFGYVPMTAGASTTWLTGAFTLEGYITRPFVEIYENGGVFLFDEMDASDPNMLLLTNNALSNDEFQNPANGKILKKHHNFIPMAAMNTRGTGANRRYVGRERLDAATLDRWAAGMVEMDYDHKLERSLFEAIING